VRPPDPDVGKVRKTVTLAWHPPPMYGLQMRLPFPFTVLYPGALT